MEKEIREGYLQVLPSFLSQILLLMNSGMILQAAFHRIARGYEDMPEKARKPFHREICRLHQESMETGENVISLFYQFCRDSGVKEMMRAAGIMMENLEKGTDLWEKLDTESKYLWKERRRTVLEKIRIAESKMSFPLGLLLMALLLVTAGPAMLQMN